jgi:Condensation domain
VSRAKANDNSCSGVRPSSSTRPTKIKDLLDSAFLSAYAQYLQIWRPLLNFTFISSANHLTAASIFGCWEPEVASHSTPWNCFPPGSPSKGKSVPFFFDRSEAAPSSPPVAAPQAPQMSPLSFGQETMLFWDKLVPHSAVYNVPIAFSIHGSLNAQALAASIDLIISRHQVLRSRFMFDRGEPTVVVTPPPQAGLSFRDLSHLPASDRASAIEEAAKAEARHPFQLAKDVMLRAALFRMTESEHLLLLTMHHIAADGWSVGVLVKELSQAYLSFIGESANTLPPLQVQYADFARWQRDSLNGPTMQRCLSFWSRQLDGVADNSELLPLDHPRPAQQTFVGATIRTALPGSSLSDFAALGQLRRATPFMVMLAALQTLLHGYSAHNDIIIGVPVANRARPEFEPLIGCFINMVAVRANLSGNPTFLDLITRTRETALAAFLHPEVPFSEVVRHLRPKRTANRTPWFQIQLVLQNYPMPEIRWPGLTVQRFEVDTATSKFDLSVLIEKKEDLEIGFEYNTDLFDSSTMHRMLEAYASLLRRVLKDPDVRLRDLSVGALVC